MAGSGCFKIGCGCVVLAIVAGIGFFAVSFMALMSFLKSSEPYQYAVKTVSDSEQVQALIGSPVEPGRMVQGSLNFENDEGNVDFSFSVKGSKGSGQVRIRGERRNSQWIYNELTFQADGDTQRINLLGSEDAAEVEAGAFEDDVESDAASGFDDGASWIQPTADEGVGHETQNLVAV